LIFLPKNQHPSDLRNNREEIGHPEIQTRHQRTAHNGLFFSTLIFVRRHALSIAWTYADFIGRRRFTLPVASMKRGSYRGRASAFAASEPPP